MIVGTGVDILSVERMARALTNHPGRMEPRLFTERERAYCAARARPEEHLAARFAAKEALLKALHVPKGLSWHELEVVNDEAGAPRFELHGEAARAVQAMGVAAVHLSLSHSDGHAIAMVVVEGAG